MCVRVDECGGAAKNRSQAYSVIGKQRAEDQIRVLSTLSDVVVYVERVEAAVTGTERGKKLVAA